MSAKPNHLDARGLRCPLPVLRARKAFKTLDIGEQLEILATDPGSVRDFQSFCETTGYALILSEEKDDGVFRYLIEKRG